MFQRIGILIIIILLMSLRVLAQSSENILTLGLPGFYQSEISEGLFDEFEAEHRVQVVLADLPPEAFIKLPDENYETQLDKLETLFTSADVVLLDDQMITLHGTRANYFLNIEPLILADRYLNISDFYPALWDSFVWDGGHWAIPISSNPLIWIYDTQAFDDALLAYPNSNWTIDDIARIAQLFSTEDGNTITPGLSQRREDLILSSLLSTMSSDALSEDDIAILEQWTQMKIDGFIDFIPDNQLQALYIGHLQELIYPISGRETFTGTLLSGGRAGVQVHGLAISNGTAQPDLAYELAIYLSKQVEFTDILGIPARQSMRQNNESSVFVNTVSPEIVDLIEASLKDAISPSQMLGIDVLVNATHIAAENNTSFSDALRITSAEWSNSLAEAEKRAEKPIVVEIPVLPQLESGEIVLRFGFDRGGWLSVYNQEQWQNLAEEFALENDTIGYVEFDTDIGFNSGTWSSDYDCIYTQHNISSFDGASYISLSPLLDADSDFDRNNILGSTLEQLQYEGNIIGYPLSLFPIILSYNPSSIPIEIEEGGWSISEMLDTLNALKDSGTSPLFLYKQIDMMIINFGGIPIDYRTNPPTVNLLDEATFNAIQQVLDLAREGLIAYEPLAPFESTFAQAQIYTSEFYPHMLDSDIDYLRIKPFPSGNDFNAASYGIGAIYISAESMYYEECYQFAKTIALHPEILTGMPARASSIDTIISYGYLESNISAFYLAYRDLLQAPNTVIIPRPVDGGEHFFEQIVLPYWVHRAYDRYVLEDADLRFELENAQSIIDNYYVCVDETKDMTTCASNSDIDFDLFGG